MRKAGFAGKTAAQPDVVDEAADEESVKSHQKVESDGRRNEHKNRTIMCFGN